jgi:hypothetical protein
LVDLLVGWLVGLLRQSARREMPARPSSSSSSSPLFLSFAREPKQTQKKTKQGGWRRDNQQDSTGCIVFFPRAE